VAVGTVTVTATADDISGVTGTKEIRVVTYDVTSITVTSASSTVGAGSSMQMTAEVGPPEAHNKAVTWSVTAGTGSATIDANGLLTGVTRGTVTVVATAQDGSGVTGTKEITITDPVTNITVSAPANTVEEGSTLQMSADVDPDGAVQDVTWSVTAGTGTATIDANGLLTAGTAGTVTVVATATDGSGVTGSKEITVTEPVSVGSVRNSTYEVYPNPSDGKFTIKLKEMKGRFVVYDLSGSAIAAGVISDYRFSLDLSSNGNGVYLLRVTTGEKSEISKLIVQ
jgi:uncharacterized protein YjdB